MIARGGIYGDHFGDGTPVSQGPTKTPGQLAYEEDVSRMPVYGNGLARVSWDKLESWAKESWEKNPTPRTYQKRAGGVDVPAGTTRKTS